MGVQDEAVPDRAEPSPTKGKARGRLETILRIVGAATAVLSLGAAVYGLAHFLYGIVHDRGAVADLVAIAENQQVREQYGEAWATLAEASEIEQTSRLLLGAGALQQARENLAMAWLENIRIGEGQSFTGIAAMVEPVLDRGQASAEPQRQADLLAHLGWAAFLRSREQSTNPDVVARLYHKALAVDPANPYANAMLGHWTIWSGHELEAARPYFAKAVASGRAAVFVRGLQLAALRNDQTAEAELEQIRVADEMRKADQPIADFDRSYLFDAYYDFFRSDVGEYSIQRLLSVIPPEQHLLTFHWLFDRAGFDDGRELTRICYVGLLQEAAGHRAEALATFRQLQQRVDAPGPIADRVQSAIQRLSIERP
jgi:hypothetical protein